MNRGGGGKRGQGVGKEGEETRRNRGRRTEDREMKKEEGVGIAD